jgi:hypothetical protein
LETGRRVDEELQSSPAENENPLMDVSRAFIMSNDRKAFGSGVLTLTFTQAVVETSEVPKFYRGLLRNARLLAVPVEANALIWTNVLE